MISDDCDAERDAREPSNDVLDLDLRMVIEEGTSMQRPTRLATFSEVRTQER
jgi:hypothetical protein